MSPSLIYAAFAIAATTALLFVALRPRAAEEPTSMDLVRKLIAEGKRIEAIKAYRRLTGCSLEDAKDFVSGITSPQKRPASASSDDVDRAILDGQLINAIKLHREATGAGLKDSKDAVEARAKELGVNR